MAAGHELGHHGFVHEGLSKATREQEREYLVRGLDALDRVARARPLGYRAPGVDVGVNTVELLLEHGFLYDASFSGSDFEPYYLRRGDRFPADGPYEFGESTELVGIPFSWGLSDFQYFEFAPGFTSRQDTPSTVYELWCGELVWAHANVPDGVVFERLGDYAARWKAEHRWPSGSPRGRCTRARPGRRQTSVSSSVAVAGRPPRRRTKASPNAASVIATIAVTRPVGRPEVESVAAASERPLPNVGFEGFGAGCGSGRTGCCACGVVLEPVGVGVEPGVVCTGCVWTGCVWTGCVWTGCVWTGCVAAGVVGVLCVLAGSVCVGAPYCDDVAISSSAPASFPPFLRTCCSTSGGSGFFVSLPTPTASEPPAVGTDST